MLGRGSAGIGAVTCGALKNMPPVKGWVKEGVGDGSWTSLIPMVAQMGVVLESVDVTLGLEGRTLHASTAGRLPGIGACDHMLAAGELGSSGGWRTSTTRGGGGRRGFMRPRTWVLTSSLFPHSSSPAPSSSRPSRAET